MVERRFLEHPTSQNKCTPNLSEPFPEDPLLTLSTPLPSPCALCTLSDEPRLIKFTSLAAAILFCYSPVAVTKFPGRYQISTHQSTACRAQFMTCCVNQHLSALPLSNRVQRPRGVNTCGQQATRSQCAVNLSTSRRRASIFWDFKRRRLIVRYRRCGTTC